MPAFLFLGKEQRKALSVIYAYCRILDDIIDSADLPKNEKREFLARSREEVENIFGGKKSTLEISSSLRYVVSKFGLRKQPFLLLIEGMEMDLTQTTYSNINELEKYMYRIASAVGLMCMPIFGFKENPAIENYAKYTGYALQLTNIMRDAAQDVKMGRVYFPIEDMNQAGYSIENMKNFLYSPNFVKLMEIECKRVLLYHSESFKVGQLLDKRKILPAFIMVEIYQTLLEKLKKARYNVFKKKFELTTFEKMAAVCKAWRKRCLNPTRG